MIDPLLHHHGRHDIRTSFRRVFNQGLIALALLLAVLMFVGEGQYSWRTVDELWNAGHIAVFALWCHLSANHWRWLAQRSYRSQLIWSLILSAVFSIVIETIQSHIGRTFDVIDIAKNLIGCLSAYVFFISARRSISRSRLRAMQAGTILLIVVSTVPLVRSAADDWAILTQFPTLSDMENPFEINRWSGSADLSVNRSIKRRGDASLKIAMDTRQYSGAALEYFMRDWREFTSLEFDLYNPDEQPLYLTCRIHDADHAQSGMRFDDRFNRKLRIDCGWNAVTIAIEEIQGAPRNRQMDLAHIQNFMVFAVDLDRPRTIYIDAVRLRR